MSRSDSMREKSFLDILTDQLKEEIREEMRAEFTAQTAQPSKPATVIEAQTFQAELWLSLHVKTQTARPGPRQGYQSKTSPRPQMARPKALPGPRKIRRGHLQTVEQILAAEFFAREGLRLKSVFSENDLKTAYRRLALKLHPDRHMSAAAATKSDYQARFTKLTACYEILSACLVIESYDSESDAA